MSRERGSAGIALVTGASRRLGIAATIALALAREGWDVATTFWRRTTSACSGAAIPLMSPACATNSRRWAPRPRRSRPISARELYSGLSEAGRRKSIRDIKLYKRRKRWAF